MIDDENFDRHPSFWGIVIHTPVQLVAGVLKY